MTEKVKVSVAGPYHYELFGHMTGLHHCQGLVFRIKV